MKVYPSMVVTGYQSGTGMSGIFGSFYYILASGVGGLSIFWIFLILTPLVPLHVITFLMLVKRRTKIGVEEGTIESENDDVKNNNSFTFQQLKNSFSKVGIYMVNIVSIYVLDYMCVVSWADRAWRYPVDSSDTNWLDNNAYTVLVFCKMFSVWFAMTS
jgi:hypothetical protein